MMPLPFLLPGGYALAISGCSATGGAASLVNYITAPCGAWFPIALIAVLIVIGIMAIIYGLSEFIGRNDIKTWVRVKIYDALLSVVFILIFAAFGTLLFTIPVASTLQSVKLFPGSGGSTPSECASQSPTKVNNLYSVASCDMFLFNFYEANVNLYIFYTFLLTSAVAPEIGFSLNFGSGSLGSGSGTGGSPSSGSSTGNLGGNIGIGASGIEIFPQYASYKFLGPVLDLFYGLILLNQVQLILIAASALIFSIFMALGLIARAFVVTRTFGGAMIAFAIGIGFIYPLLVSINYGFLVYALSTNTLSSLVNLSSGTIAFFGVPLMFINLMASLTTGLTGSALSFFSLGSYPYTQLVGAFPSYLFEYFGLVISGLMFIPVLELVLVDVFIIDFSQAIGERMDLLSLFTRLL